MPKKKSDLTDHQRAALQAAAYSKTLIAWPLPHRLKLSKGSATIVAKGLIKRGLVEERPALSNDPIWREGEGGLAMTLVITKAGLAACGMSAKADQQENPAHEADSGPTAAVSEDQRRMPRAGSKLAILLALLRRDEGATVDEMAEATGWQPHTVRGVMSGALARRFGVATVSEKVEGRGRVYYLK